MAVARLLEMQANLLDHGQFASISVAIVEIGARPERRVLTGRPDRLHDLAVRLSIVSAEKVYAGDVARLADELGWYGGTPCRWNTIFGN